MGFGELPAKHWHVSGETTVLWWTPQGSPTRGMEVLSRANLSQALPKSSKPRGLVSSLHLVGPVSSRCSREPEEPHPTVSFPAPHWKFEWFPPCICSSSALKQVSKTHLYETPSCPAALGFAHLHIGDTYLPGVLQHEKCACTSRLQSASIPRHWAGIPKCHLQHLCPWRCHLKTFLSG